MPLEQWAAFYGAVQAQRMEEQAMQVGIVHAANPRKTQQSLMRAAGEASKGQKNIAYSKDRLKGFLRGVRGVKVETVKRETPE